VYRRFVWRRFVEETFCRGDVLSRRRFVCASTDLIGYLLLSHRLNRFPKKAVNVAYI
jgi:hypothetical protein